MRAIAHTAFGAPSRVLQLRDLAVPVAGPGQLLVRVAAAGVVRGDWLITQGLPYIARPSWGLRAPKHAVAGQAFAGTVVSTGDDVTTHAPGAHVFGVAQGTLAEFAVVDASAATPVPDGVSFADAATIPISGVAALQALRDVGDVQPGQRVLVIGASGAVGSYAVQLARVLGAHVTGVASTANLPLVRSLGAHDVIDYTRESLDARGGGYDVLVDLAGNRSLRTLRTALAPRGTAVLVGGTGGRWTMGFGRTIRALLISPFVSQRLAALFSTPNADDQRMLVRHLEDGAVRAVVAREYPLGDAATAIADVARGRGAGSLVIAP
jgi:NADPH:quinone reductase-like Zn-dependent oxidoreductase